MACAKYAANQPIFAGSAPNPDMSEPVTAEKALNDCCTHLLTAIGLEAMHPRAGNPAKSGLRFSQRPRRPNRL